MRTARRHYNRRVRVQLHWTSVRKGSTLVATHTHKLYSTRLYRGESLSLGERASCWGWRRKGGWIDTRFFGAYLNRATERIGGGRDGGKNSSPTARSGFLFSSRQNRSQISYGSRHLRQQQQLRGVTTGDDVWYRWLLRCGVFTWKGSKVSSQKQRMWMSDIFRDCRLDFRETIPTQGSLPRVFRARADSLGLFSSDAFLYLHLLLRRNKSDDDV